MFGNVQNGYDLPIRRDWRFGELRLGPQQVENLAVALVLMAGVFLFLRFTRTGKTMRAVADNPALADIKGIDAARVGRIVSFGAMGLAGIGGMLIGLDTSVDPLTGYRVMLSVFAAAVVGGLGSIPGAVVGALVVGVGGGAVAARAVAQLSRGGRVPGRTGGAGGAAARHPRAAGVLRWRTTSSRWVSRPASMR